MNKRKTNCTLCTCITQSRLICKYISKGKVFLIPYPNNSPNEYAIQIKRAFKKLGLPGKQDYIVWCHLRNMTFDVILITNVGQMDCVKDKENRMVPNMLP